MILKFSEDVQSFGIFFNKEEFHLARKLLANVKCDDNESLLRLLAIMSRLEELEQGKPTLTLVKK